MKTLLIRALPLLLAVPFAQAQNDDCAGAIAIGPGVTPYDTTGSTDSLPPWPCAAGGSDIWYSYTTGATGESLSVDTCTGATGYDSALEVFDACGGTSIQCNDDFCGLQSTVSWGGAANTTYFIRVGGFAAGQGAGELNLTSIPDAPTTLGQDDCADAANDSISGDGTWEIDNGGATDGAEGQNEANCYKFSTSAVQSDVWVLWTPTVSGSVTMDTCAAGGSNSDTKMAAYPGPDCPADGTSLDCNDDTCGLRSTINFTVCCGDSYLIQLGSFPGSADGTFFLTATQSGTDCGGAADVWTQSVDNSTIIPGSIACQGGGITDNSWLRLYDPIAQGENGPFTISSVTFGVELAQQNTNGSTPITVNLRDGSNFGLFANMPILDTAVVDVPDTDITTQTFVTVPFSLSLPAGQLVAVEIFAPNGQADGSVFFPASNNLGQTDPNYIAAADCGLPDPLDLALIGFPDSHLILDLGIGDGDPAVIGCNYCGPAVPNSAGLSGVITATGDNTAGASFTLTASNLPGGAFGIFICNDFNGEFIPATSNGVFCLKGGGANLGRFFPPFMADGSGSASILADSGALPTASIDGDTVAMLPGDTWYFQCYYRDGARTNFTDATAITFE